MKQMIASFFFLVLLYFSFFSELLFPGNWSRVAATLYNFIVVCFPIMVVFVDVLLTRLEGSRCGKE